MADRFHEDDHRIADRLDRDVEREPGQRQRIPVLRACIECGVEGTAHFSSCSQYAEPDDRVVSPEPSWRPADRSAS